jgi:hypothetical protein
MLRVQRSLWHTLPSRTTTSTIEEGRGIRQGQGNDNEDKPDTERRVGYEGLRT